MEMVGCRLSLRVLMGVLMIVSSYSVLTVKGEDCGRQVGGRLCPSGLCCSQWGWCGNTPDHCSANCQSQCGSAPTPPTPSGGVGSIVTASVFENMLRHRKDSGCQGAFYTYSAFIKAAQSYPNFGKVGSLEVRKREIAAFFGQTSHETTGGWATAPDGAFAWGYCFTEERNKATYCQPSAQWPCNGNKKYYGRGPIQLTWNYNYGPAGKAIGFDGLNNPEAVANNAIISFKTALWFWMTAQSPKPSCHDVMVGKWRPSNSDTAAGRQAGFGMVTNIINGGLECGKGSTNEKEQDRIGFFKRYCSILGVSTGPNLSCQGQRPYTVTSKTPQEEEAAAATTSNNNNNNDDDDDDNDALIREVAEN